MRGTSGTSDPQFKKIMFLTFGDIHGPKPYEFLGFGDIHGPNACEFMGFGDIHGLKYGF